jgi:NTE family protein
MTTTNAETNRRDSLALVLSGGGARAAYQVGVLRAIAERFPDLQIQILTGVSAGALNMLYLASHPGPFRQAVEGLGKAWLQLTPRRVYAVRPLDLGRAAVRWIVNMVLRRGPPQPSLHGLMDVSPLRGFLAAAMNVDGVQRNIDGGRLRAAALSATRYDTGETITFVQAAPDVPVWERYMRIAVRTRIDVRHLMASASIPLVFPAVKLDDGFYGDGSVRQTAPLAPAIHLGATRIIGVAMRARTTPAPRAAPTDQYPVAAEVFGLLLHSVFLDTLDADAERLERINALLSALPDPTVGPGDMRPVDLLLLRPSRDLGDLVRDRAVRLPRMVQLLVSSIGGERTRSSDLLSYLMFQPEYIGVLMELGYDDTRKRMPEVEAFLS